MNPKTFLSALTLLWCATAFAQRDEIERITIEVPAKANLYFHEIVDTSKVRGGAGIPPVAIDIKGVKMIAFEDVEGLVSCFGEYDTTYHGPDGGEYGAKTDVHQMNALSGIKHDKKVMFLSGVLLSDYSYTILPNEADDYTYIENYEEKRPSFNQVFFIGDGKNDRGIQQKIHTSSDATLLYLGFADCLVGPPQNYSNNEGSIKLTVVLYRGNKGRN